MPLVALLSDFGTSDPYVGVMKGVIATRCPDAQFIDITHEISPQNIQQAAYLLRSAYRYFPPHTIFLVVVDPGVGTGRQPVAIKTDHGTFVGPDNGVFSTVVDEADTWQAVALWPPQHLSGTFHGRDLFAPVAGELACGRTLLELGTPTVDLLRITLPQVSLTSDSTLNGEIIHIDHFGNLITSVGPLEWQSEWQSLRFHPKGDLLSTTDDIVFEAGSAEVIVGAQRLRGIHTTYAASRPGDLLALVNSDRRLEIAVNQGNAVQVTSARIRDPIQVNFKPEKPQAVNE
jgi:S-adenosylmethionine hydrolase